MNINIKYHKYYNFYKIKLKLNKNQLPNIFFGYILSELIIKCENTKEESNLTENNNQNNF